MGFFYRSSPGVAIDPQVMIDLTDTAYRVEPIDDPELRRAEMDSLFASKGLGHVLTVAKKKEEKGDKAMTTSKNPSGWVLFSVALLLIGLYLMGFFLEADTRHAHASAIAFNSFQIAFPGFLGLLGLETAKHG